MATSPATTPDAAPSEVALPCRKRSTRSQASIAAMVAMVVLRKVTPVSDMNWPTPPSLASVLMTIEPTLKPYQPVHSRPAPIIVSVRLCGFIGSLGRADPPADDQREHAAGDTGVDVHDRAAGVVLRVQVLGDPAAAPHHVGQREVAEGDPHGEEDHPRGELDPVGDRAADQRRGDHREGQLEADGDVALRAHALQAEERERVGERVAVAGRRRRTPTSPTARRRCPRPPSRRRTSSSCSARTWTGSCRRRTARVPGLSSSERAGSPRSSRRSSRPQGLQQNQFSRRDRLRRHCRSGTRPLPRTFEAGGFTVRCEVLRSGNEFPVRVTSVCTEGWRSRRCTGDS